ncbi:hypothetical protein [Hwangdonia seohaensis]|uniref:SCP domain-containing protein n=1 Tax=Hwangdonia seohaensis TaxID=1240727 RepID=A0ABW3RBZ3_9FLAO|nr:hypothetical protein [Hwangdonia seohaensis]
MKTIKLLPYILLFCISINAQTSTYNFDTSDVFMIKSPSENYKDILLQSHNGLPRFGVLNRYEISRGKIEPNSREKSKLISESYSSYIGLIQMDYMKAMYNDFNRTVRALTRPNGTTKKEENSYKAQQHFWKLASQICTETTGDIHAGTNEFERRRNYKDFVANNLDGLRNWSNTILKNNSINGYWVNMIRLKDYDFDKKGYWINIILSNVRQRNSRFSTKYNFFKNYVPKHGFETKLYSEKNKLNTTPAIKVLFKISPEEAEKIQQPTKLNRGTVMLNTLYAAAKIKVTIKPFVEDQNNRTPEIPEFDHHFISPIIVLYKDAALTKKVGEISLEN